MQSVAENVKFHGSVVVSEVSLAMDCTTRSSMFVPL